MKSLLLLVIVLAAWGCSDPGPIPDTSLSRPKPAKLDKNVMIVDKP